MNKKEKVQLLTDLKRGKRKLADLVPKLDVFLIESEKDKWLDSTNGYKIIEATDLETYIRSVELNNPDKQVAVKYMSFEEYIAISQMLDNEY